MGRLRIPTLNHPAETDVAIRTAVKVISSQTNFPDTGNSDHVRARRGEVIEAKAALCIARQFGMISSGTQIGRKDLPWENRFPQHISIGGNQPEIDLIPSGREGQLIGQVKGSGGGSSQIKGAAGLIVIDHLAPQGQKDNITGLLYADAGPEGALRYTCVRALYEVFGGAPHNAINLNERLLGGPLPGNTGLTDDVRQAFYRSAGLNLGKAKDKFEKTLEDLRNNKQRTLSGDEMLRLIEPLAEMFGFRELAVMDLRDMGAPLGDTVAMENSLKQELGPAWKAGQEIVEQSKAASAEEASAGQSSQGGGESSSGGSGGSGPTS
jgi:hypothetical protein